MARSDLAELLSQLDDTTRERWGDFLARIEAEIEEKGPGAVREHIEAALAHILAIGWALHRCYSTESSAPMMGPLGEAATTVEELKSCLDLIEKKPEWTQ